MHVTASVMLPSTGTPAISDAEGVPTPGRVVVGGDFVTSGLYYASVARLFGTISYEGEAFDLGSVD